MSGIIKPPFGAQLNQSHPLAQGLVGCWLFNEGSGGKAYDLSGEESHGTLTNIADPPISISGWNPGLHGGALAFDGSDDYVEILKTPALSPPTVSISVRFRPSTNASNSFPVLIVNGMSYILHIIDTDELKFKINEDNSNCITTTTLNMVMEQQYHAIGTYDANSLNLYINGSWFATQAKTGNLNIDSGGFRFGAFLSGQENSTRYKGSIDSILIFNRALSAEEVAYLYAFPYCMFDESVYPTWMLPGAPPGVATKIPFWLFNQAALGQGVA
jgi:hypothetical protein